MTQRSETGGYSRALQVVMSIRFVFVGSIQYQDSFDLATGHAQCEWYVLSNECFFLVALLPVVVPRGIVRPHKDALDLLWSLLDC